MGPDDCHRDVLVHHIAGDAPSTTRGFDHDATHAKDHENRILKVMEKLLVISERVLLDSSSPVSEGALCLGEAG
jgi:hypothetical protein